jgi:Uma2 family endonuclease
MTVLMENPKRWTVEECERLEAQGFLAGKYELIDGVIVDKMGQNTPHVMFLRLLTQMLAHWFGLEYVAGQVPIRILGELGKTNEPLPDIVVTDERARAYAKRLPSPEDLHLVAEVSDSSLRFDTETKALLYAQAGIVEYWVVDVQGMSLIVHRNPTPHGYEAIRIYSQEERVAPLLHSHNPQSLAFLFSEDEVELE